MSGDGDGVKAAGTRGVFAALVRLLPARTIRSLILRANLLGRGVSLGVRVIVENRAGEMLLVRHGYVPGWHLPGGAVDLGESAEAAAIRELREETGVRASERPTLIGLYRNRAGAGRDHVALFCVGPGTFDAAGAMEGTGDGEITATGWFAPDALPADTTAATRARLAERRGDKPLSEFW